MKSPDNIVQRRTASERRWPVFTHIARLACALLSLPIRGYRYAISPMLPASCRFFSELFGIRARSAAPARSTHRKLAHREPHLPLSSLERRGP